MINKDGWYVVIGKGLFFVGLSTEWPKLGFIVSKIQDRAKIFSNIDDARKLAEDLGGRVYRA